MSREWDEIEIPVPWGIVAGKWWGDKNKQPVIAIHGLDDNAGTFDELCPLLTENFPILCIDLPGHGKSSHYPRGQQYYAIWDGLTLIRRIAKHYNWKKITLMGHSLGGVISLMYAATFPNDIEKFVLIDIPGVPVKHTNFGIQFGKGIDNYLKFDEPDIDDSTCYSYSDILKIFLDVYDGSLTKRSAEILMKRSITKAPDYISKTGYCFSRDRRLTTVPLRYSSMTDYISYAEQIHCNVLSIRGNPGVKISDPTFTEKFMDALRKPTNNVEFIEVPGTHHLHLNTPELVAPLINKFLSSI